jgi:hypothetical protein
MSKHTPGPWVVDDLGDKYFCETNHKYGIGSKNSPCYRLAKVEGLGVVSLANACLIAAAPMLLAELENIANADTREWVPGMRDMFKEWAQARARDAIRKATGERDG